MPPCYSVNSHSVETILAWVKAGEIAIPEIQRPFVWDAANVRDLLDSFYNGYPVGYLIAWRNPNVRLKDGSISEGKKVLIDGQQRVTALMAAVLGQKVLTKDYQFVRIRIAFNPLERKFEVLNPAIGRDASWIPDVSSLLCRSTFPVDVYEDYCAKNSGADKGEVLQTLTNLQSLRNNQIGFIELAHELDIETVTEIFIRINSKGVVLNQADFAMSKIAASDQYGGPVLRKAIDYFCQLAVAPDFHSQLAERDTAFAATDWFRKMSWLKNENEDLYDPSYTDVLRVACVSAFERGKLADLVSLLSGRNFETRQYEDVIAEASFKTLGDGVMNFINETHFQRFLMIIRSSGFIATHMIRSQNALNFSYALYLKLRMEKYDPAKIEKLVRRWFVLSLLTSRYSGAFESRFDSDIKRARGGGFVDYLEQTEKAELSDSFWEFGLVQELEKASTNSPYLNIFWAAQVKLGDRGLLSKEITVRDLIDHQGDIHHIFPKDYLKKNGMKRGEYNQIANFAYTQSEINIRIGNKSPKEYFSDIFKQCADQCPRVGAICDESQLRDNLSTNCIPDNTLQMDHTDYKTFLAERRNLMSLKIKYYYSTL